MHLKTIIIYDNLMNFQKHFTANAKKVFFKKIKSKICTVLKINYTSPNSMLDSEELLDIL